MTLPADGGQPLTTLPNHRPPVSYLADPAHRNSDLGGESPDTAAVLARLRHHLRTVLSTELPKRAETAHPRSPIDHDQRKGLAWAILDEAAQAHSEAELMANRMLAAKDAEQQVITEVINEVFGMAGLQPLLDDPNVETVNVNRFDRVFVQYHDGRRAQLPAIAASNDELTNLVRMLAARASSEERRFDRGAPAVNLQLPGGERLFAVMALTSDGVTALSIRRHGYRTVTLPQLRDVNTVDFGLEQFLRSLVRARKNIVITGGTGSGKTTMLRALASEMDPMERIVTIEDAFELGLDTDPERHADVTALQAREPNIEGEGGISQAELVRWGLRMSPDRVIVGEIRGPEVIPMCSAMSQGNDGSMATLHASSSRIAFTRLASYAAQGAERLPLEVVASAVHFVVHLASTAGGGAGHGGTRVVSSIREVVGAEGPHVISNEVYRPGPNRRALPVPGALRTDTLEDLIEAGLDPSVLERPTGWWPQ